MKKLAVKLCTSLSCITALAACQTSTRPNRNDNVNSPVGNPICYELRERLPTSGKISNDADINYMVSLGIIKAHLIVVGELLEPNRPYEEASRIFNSTLVVENYCALAEEFPRRNVEDFKAVLDALSGILLTDAAKSTRSPAGTDYYEEALQAVDSAIAALPSEKRESPAFILQVINYLLAAAETDYAAAISANPVTQPSDPQASDRWRYYQTSRGSFLYSMELFQSISSQLEAQAPDVYLQIRNSLEKLGAAWPKVTPPESPILLPKQVSVLIDEITAASKVVTQ